jgi:2-iminobutanoate/2-iminopropanoate deaminase
VDGKQAISTSNAAPPGGPYSQGIRWGNLIFTASVGSRRPGQPDPAPDDFEAQVANTLENLKAILEAGGSSLDNVLKVTAYLRDRSKFEQMNEVYRRYFTGTPPARALVLVADGGPISFDAVAFVGEG